MATLPPLPPELESLPRSGIRVVMDRAWQLGEPITHLEVGEPGFATADHIIEAFTQAAESGATRYTANSGIEPLREACALKLATINDIHVDPNQILITVGAMQGLLSAVMGLAGHGDEILTPTPGWPNYQMLITTVGALPVSYELHPEHGYQPDPEQIRSLITPRTKMIILNTPSNPLGVVLSAEVIDEILEIAHHHGIWVLSDECYDQIVFDEPMTSPASRSLGPEQTITINSFSKSYAMTGFRLGYLSATPRVASLLTKLQESMVACVNTPAQHAGVAALEGPQDHLDEMVRQYRARRDLAVDRAQTLGLQPRSPAGAFYLWLELPGVADSMEFAEQLLTTHRVAVAPGSTFGEPGGSAIRISLAADPETITTGLDAIGAMLDTTTNMRSNTPCGK